MTALDSLHGVLPLEPGQHWFLYLVRCRNGTLYTGITTDVERRFAEHQQGGPRGARYLRGKGPLELVYVVAAGDRARASSLEHRVKALTRTDKQSLIAGTLSLLPAVSTTMSRKQ